MLGIQILKSFVTDLSSSSKDVKESRPETNKDQLSDYQYILSNFQNNLDESELRNTYLEKRMAEVTNENLQLTAQNR